MRVDRKARAVALLLGLSLAAAACGDDDGGGGGGGGNANQGSDKFEGKEGGTLRLKGAGDVDHLDTASAYYTVSYSILRGLSRQLVSYPTTKDEKVRDVPTADVAEPGDYASEDGKTYTFKIKQGVKWENKGGTNGRQVVANDFVVGLKRLCDPNNPSGGLVYFQDTIVGFTEFCTGFEKAVDLKADEAKRIAAVDAYIKGNQISGIKTTGEDTISFSLKQPAGDFLNILAMPFASAVAPEVALKYIADSPNYRKNFVSNGPYKLAEYTPEKSIRLVRNTEWDKSTDKLRAAFVNEIVVTQGSDEEPVQQEIEAGTVDLAWDVGVPTPQIAALKGDPIQGLDGSDQRLYLNPDGCVSYIVMATDRKPFNDKRVRQAVNYGIDRSAIVQIAGGRDVQEPHYNVLTPPILGYKPYEAYKTEGDKGDPAKAQALLKEAGYTSPLKVTFLHRNAGKHPSYAQTHQAALKKAGFDVVLKAVTPAQFYTEFLQKVNNKEWDFAQPGWCPDWAGNAARTFFSPLLDGRIIKDGATNYGHYNNPDVNAKIDEALAEADLDKAADLWAELDKTVMDDAVWAPVMTGKVANYRSERVKNWVYFPFSHQADFTNVALDPATP
jgi:peptide/nickel transport system substrate-binding protein